MSKVKSLVKKIVVFEKLANFGSMKDFLSSLADAGTSTQETTNDTHVSENTEKEMPIKPAVLSRLQEVTNQIGVINSLSNELKNRPPSSKIQNLKKINHIVTALQAALKNDHNWDNVKDYVVGRKLIIDSLRSLYDKLEYDNLKLVPSLVTALNYSKKGSGEH